MMTTAPKKRYRALSPSFRPATDPTRARRFEEDYIKAILPLFDDYERSILKAFKSRARALGVPSVQIPLDWFTERIGEIAVTAILDPAKEKQKLIVHRTYTHGVTFADIALKSVGIVGTGSVDWRALDALQVRNITALEGITAEMNKRIVSGLTEGLLSGEGIPKLARAIREAVDGIGRARAETMARTETLFAINQGTVIRYGQAGVKEVRFLAGLDERVCEECESLHGEIFPIGEEPTLPLHPNCRCTWVPVLGVRDE